jgi:hypothetical protein
LLLLGLDRPTMKWLAGDIDRFLADTAVTRNRHQSQLSSREGEALLTVFTAPSWSLADISEKLAEMKLRKYDTHADRSLAIFVTPGADAFQLVDYAFDATPWQEDRKVEDDVRRRKSSFMREFKRAHGMPKPNVRCPCGSGRKFKICCHGL